MSKRQVSMQRAKNTKNDEFYTMYHDIANECDRYLEQFSGKCIYCNCDTKYSNFVRYFINLKNRGLIKDVIWSGGINGLDFRGSESVALLKKADIVVSNPPFSLFREYIGQLLSSEKQFLILGNQNCVSYKDLFPLFVSDKIRLGYRRFGSMLFDTPDGNMASISVAWFTNLKVSKRPPLILTRTFTGHESEYPVFDNIDAISVRCKKDIPRDYFGLMGVPITFLDKYNPSQFNLVGSDIELTRNHDRCTINGQRMYARIFIKRNIANDNQCLTEIAA